MFLGFNRTGNRIDDDSFFLEAIDSYILEREENISEGLTLSLVANLSNISSLIFAYLEDINWAGFYILECEKLILGPFQGEPACSLINIGRGVCGTSAKERKSIIVPDVSKFPGHIACSGKSRSELVVPIISNDKLIGVIDIDSPILNRFSEADKSLIEKVADKVARLFS